ncbi:MAG: maleate cis-trans isomerase family protein [Galactobacter sp.]
MKAASGHESRLRTTSVPFPGPAVAVPGPSPRAAVGVVVPFDMELDRELWRWLPDDVDLLMTRTPFIDDVVTVDFVRELGDGDAIPAGVRAVTAGRASVVAYACTSASFVGGGAGEVSLRAEMAGAGAVDPVTTSGAIVEALHALDAERAVVATPYTLELSQLLDRFLAEHGIHTLRNRGLGLDRNIWEVPYQRTADLIRDVDLPEAEAIVVSCTNLPTYDLIAPLEDELGKPIVAANQATMWAVLKRLGRVGRGGGQRLFAV